MLYFACTSGICRSNRSYTCKFTPYIIQICMKKYNAMITNLLVSLCIIFVLFNTFIIHITAMLEKEVTAVAKLYVSLFIFYVCYLISIHYDSVDLHLVVECHAITTF